MQKYLYEHFDLPGNFLKDVSVTLIDKADHRDPPAREYYWIYPLQSKTPVGLNMEDGFLN